MQKLKDVMERMQPTPETRGDWDAVLRDAGVRRRPTLLRPLAAVVVSAAALFGLALFQPWDGESPTVLERALAAVDDGPVLHAVLRGEWGGTLVDLETGARRPVHGENEVWYDSERGLVHMISRLGNVVQHELVYEPEEPPAELVALGREYRSALQSGSARVTGEGVIDGEPVYWITIHSEMLPDSSDGKLHEWAQQVAVSRETFTPVATREIRDAEPGPGTRHRVLKLETLPAGQGDFTAAEENTLDGMTFSEGREQITPDEAEQTLGTTPLWLGSEHRDLSLAQISRTTISVGRRHMTELRGADAAAARACGRFEGDEARGRCIRRLGRPSLQIRGKSVYTFGPVKWDEEHTSLAFFYGTLGDDPSTYHKDVIPLWSRPHVAITEATRLSPVVRGGKFVPPDGSVFVGAGGRMGSLRVDGIFVSIEASDEELMLSAARALEPMPG